MLPLRLLVGSFLRHVQRLNQRSGRRFELAVARKLRAVGRPVRLVDETTGFSRGVDITVGEPLEPPCFAIQCKATRKEADLWKAFVELDCTGRNHWFSGWFVVHSWRRPGKRPLIRVRGKYRHGPMTQWNSLEAFVEDLKNYPN